MVFKQKKNWPEPGTNDANLFIKKQQLGKEIFMSPCRILYELSRPDKID